MYRGRYSPEYSPIREDFQDTDDWVIADEITDEENDDDANEENTTIDESLDNTKSSDNKNIPDTSDKQSSPEDKVTQLEANKVTSPIPTSNTTKKVDNVDQNKPNAIINPTKEAIKEPITAKPIESKPPQENFQIIQKPVGKVDNSKQVKAPGNVPKKSSPTNINAHKNVDTPKKVNNQGLATHKKPEPLKKEDAKTLQINKTSKEAKQPIKEETAKLSTVPPQHSLKSSIPNVKDSKVPVASKREVTSSIIPQFPANNSIASKNLPDNKIVEKKNKLEVTSKQVPPETAAPQTDSKAPAKIEQKVSIKSMKDTVVNPQKEQAVQQGISTTVKTSPKDSSLTVHENKDQAKDTKVVVDSKPSIATEKTNSLPPSEKGEAIAKESTDNKKADSTKSTLEVDTKGKKPKKEDKLEKLKFNIIDDKRPLLGVEYIVKLEKDNDEYSFNCAICSKDLLASDIISHLTFGSHRIKFLEIFGLEAKNFPQNHMKNWSSANLVVLHLLCQKVEAQCGRKALTVLKASTAKPPLRPYIKTDYQNKIDFDVLLKECRSKMQRISSRELSRMRQELYPETKSEDKKKSTSGEDKKPSSHNSEAKEAGPGNSSISLPSQGAHPSQGNILTSSVPPSINAALPQPESTNNLPGVSKSLIPSKDLTQAPLPTADKKIDSTQVALNKVEQEVVPASSTKGNSDPLKKEGHQDKVRSRSPRTSIPSKGRRSRSRDRRDHPRVRSRSKARRSLSKGRRSRSRDRRALVRNRSRSKGRRSQSRGGRSRSRDRRAPLRNRSRSREGRRPLHSSQRASADRNSRRRRSRSFSIGKRMRIKSPIRSRDHKVIREIDLISDSTHKNIAMSSNLRKRPIEEIAEFNDGNNPKNIKLENTQLNYTEEWSKFYAQRWKQLKTAGKNPETYDYETEWSVYWNNLLKKAAASFRASLKKSGSVERPRRKSPEFKMDKDHRIKSESRQTRIDEDSFSSSKRINAPSKGGWKRESAQSYWSQEPITRAPETPEQVPEAPSLTKVLKESFKENPTNVKYDLINQVINAINEKPSINQPSNEYSPAPPEPAAINVSSRMSPNEYIAISQKLAVILTRMDLDNIPENKLEEIIQSVHSFISTSGANKSLSDPNIESLFEAVIKYQLSLAGEQSDSQLKTKPNFSTNNFSAPTANPTGGYWATSNESDRTEPYAAPGSNTTKANDQWRTYPTQDKEAYNPFQPESFDKRFSTNSFSDSTYRSNSRTEQFDRKSSPGPMSQMAYNFENRTTTAFSAKSDVPSINRPNTIPEPRNAPFQNTFDNRFNNSFNNPSHRQDFQPSCLPQEPFSRMPCPPKQQYDQGFEGNLNFREGPGPHNNLTPKVFDPRPSIEMGAPPRFDARWRQEQPWQQTSQNFSQGLPRYGGTNQGNFRPF